jgi:hypothetical protein
MTKQVFIKGAFALAAFLFSGTAFTQDATPAAAAEGTQQADGSNGAVTTTTTTTTAGAGAADTGAQATVPTPGTVVDIPRRDERAAKWDISGGYEADDNDTSYAFFGPSYNRPLNDNVALRLSVNVNHLKYQFENGEGGTTEVEAPGISPGVGLRFGNRNWFQVTGGVSIRDESRRITGAGDTLLSDEDDRRTGLFVGADAWYNTSRRSNLHAMVHYGGVSNYLWSRLAGRQQISNFDWRGPVSFYLGAEVVGQGNEDIKSWQVGPILEMALAHTQLSLTARGGYKRSTFDVGEDKSGPYFGVGIWKRF